MKLPSQKTLTALIFFGFLAILITALVLYFGQAILNTNLTADTNGQNENRGFTFFPFGRGGIENNTPFVPVDTETGDEPGNNTGGTNTPVVDIDRLRQISTVPAAGGYVYTRQVEDDSLFSSAPETEDVMRYVESSTGHIYETTADTKLVTRVTNTTIPRIIHAEFLGGDQPILQYRDNATDRKKTFSARVVSAIQENGGDGAGTGRLSGIFLQDEIKDLVVAGTDVIYTIETPSGGISLRVTDQNGNDVQEIFNSELKQWHITPYGDDDVVLNHVPSFNSFGYAQTVDISSQALSKLYSGQLSLQVLPNNDGSRLLVSFWDGEAMSLYVLDNGELQDTGLDTFAEKCVWSSDNIFAYCAEPLNDIEFGAPDAWYKGLELYADDYYQINTNVVAASLLFSPFEEGNYSIDVTRPELSANEKFLSFIDKGTQTFWTYQLEL